MLAWLWLGELSFVCMTSPYHTIPRLAMHAALTPLEEKMSMPLQTLYLAVFDMIMFRIVDEAMPEGE